MLVWVGLITCLHVLNASEGGAFAWCVDVTDVLA